MGGLSWYLLHPERNALGPLFPEHRAVFLLCFRKCCCGTGVEVTVTDLLSFVPKLKLYQFPLPALEGIISDRDSES